MRCSGPPAQGSSANALGTITPIIQTARTERRRYLNFILERTRNGQFYRKSLYIPARCPTANNMFMFPCFFFDAFSSVSNAVTRSFVSDGNHPIGTSPELKMFSFSNSNEQNK